MSDNVKLYSESQMREIYNAGINWHKKLQGIRTPDDDFKEEMSAMIPANTKSSKLHQKEVFEKIIEHIRGRETFNTKELYDNFFPTVVQKFIRKCIMNNWINCCNPKHMDRQYIIVKTDINIKDFL